MVPNCPAVLGPAKSRCHTQHPRYVVLTFSLPDPKSSRGYAASSSSQMGVVARAREARPPLALFPDFANEIVRCPIPRGGPRGGSIDGTCVTYALLSGHARRVEFIERWPLNEPVGRRSKAGWIVTLSRDGRVRSIRVTGRPPQLWR